MKNLVGVRVTTCRKAIMTGFKKARVFYCAGLKYSLNHNVYFHGNGHYTLQDRQVVNWLYICNRHL